MQNGKAGPPCNDVGKNWLNESFHQPSMRIINGLCEVVLVGVGVGMSRSKSSRSRRRSSGE